MPSTVIIGNGRMGSALASALRGAGADVRGPLGRGEPVAGGDVVLLCVPDREIAAAAASVAPGPLVGHVSASAPLDLLAPRERFSMHPLLSVVGAGAHFDGAYCAIDGSSPTALQAARAVAELLGMHVLVVPREHYESLVDIPHALAMHIFEVAMELAPVVRQMEGTDGLNVVVNSGAAAGQDVFHYHVHVIRHDHKVAEPVPHTLEMSQGFRHDARVRGVA